jgi:hypothetical protein
LPYGQHQAETRLGSNEKIVSRIIAVMLGRLRMTLDECEDAYLKLSKHIFKPKRRFGVAAKAADYLQANGRFDSKMMENVIRDVIRGMKHDEDALLKDADPRCKV